MMVGTCPMRRMDEISAAALPFCAPPAFGPGFEPTSRICRLNKLKVFRDWIGRLDEVRAAADISQWSDIVTRARTQRVIINLSKLPEPTSRPKPICLIKPPPHPPHPPALHTFPLYISRRTELRVAAVLHPHALSAHTTMPLPPRHFPSPPSPSSPLFLHTTCALESARTCVRVCVCACVFSLSLSLSLTL